MRNILFASLLLVACNNKAPVDRFAHGNWQIVQIADGKNAAGSPMSMNYNYTTADSLKAMIHFLNDTTYVVKDLFEKGTDTNYFEMHKDTLVTNREPRDFLVVTKGEKDSLFLINQLEGLVFTVVPAR